MSDTNGSDSLLDVLSDTLSDVFGRLLENVVSVPIWDFPGQPALLTTLRFDVWVVKTEEGYFRIPMTEESLQYFIEEVVPALRVARMLESEFWTQMARFDEDLLDVTVENIGSSAERLELAELPEFPTKAEDELRDELPEASDAIMNFVVHYGELDYRHDDEEF